MKKKVKPRLKKARFCPKCQNKDIILYAGGGIGLYQCKNCGFKSSIFPEKEIHLNPKPKK